MKNNVARVQPPRARWRLHVGSFPKIWYSKKISIIELKRFFRRDLSTTSISFAHAVGNSNRFSITSGETVLFNSFCKFTQYGVFNALDSRTLLLSSRYYINIIYRTIDSEKCAHEEYNSLFHYLWVPEKSLCTRFARVLFIRIARYYRSFFFLSLRSPEKITTHTAVYVNNACNAFAEKLFKMVSNVGIR